jgi:hypothetical protein
MDITIGTLAWLMNQQGIQDGLSLTIIMGTLTGASVVFLLVYFRNFKTAFL